MRSFLLACRHRVTTNAARQRQRTPGKALARCSGRLPIFVAQLSMMQVLDACAADFAQARERRGIRADPDQKIRPGSSACQRRTKMRRAEKDEVVEPLWPRVAGERCVVAGAARDE